VNKFLYSPQNKMPNIEMLKQQIPRAKIFIQLDIGNVFLTLPLHLEHWLPTAFRYKGNLNQYTRVPFGLVSSMAIFVDTMSKPFEDLKDCVITYVNDVTVFSKTVREHYKHLERVLQKISKVGITLNLLKSEFVIPELKFVGYIINQYGIKLNPEKAELVKLIQPPKCVKDIKKFLGVTNFFMTNMPNYNAHSGILNHLMKKDTPWR